MCVHNVSSAMHKEHFPLHLLLRAHKISTESTVNAESMFQINRWTLKEAYIDNIHANINELEQS